YAGQNAGNLNGYNAVQNVGNQVAQNPKMDQLRLSRFVYGASIQVVPST
nr:hypothetical protein [Tanacetum cinerariifolium]